MALIAGFPFFLFGLFLALSQANGMEGDVALRFSLSGPVSVLCGLGIRAYLRRRDGWFCRCPWKQEQDSSLRDRSSLGAGGMRGGLTVRLQAGWSRSSWTVPELRAVSTPHQE